MCGIALSVWERLGVDPGGRAAPERRGAGSGGRPALALAPFSAYALLILLTTLLIRSAEPRLLSSLVIALAVLAGAGIGALLESGGRSVRSVTLALLTVLLAVNFHAGTSAAAAARAAGARADERVVERLRAEAPATRLLVPQTYLPVAVWYAPRLDVRAYFSARDLLAALDGWPAEQVLVQGLEDEALTAEICRRLAPCGRERVAPLPGGREILLFTRGRRVD